MFTGRNSSTERPRTAIWVDEHHCKKWNCLLQNEFSNNDMTTISAQITNQGTKIQTFICPIYMPTRDGNKNTINNPICDTLKKLIVTAKDKKIEIIIGSDVNAHNKVWGEKKNDARGNRIHDFLLENNLQLLNCGSKSTFKSGTKSSIIDITISSRKIYKFFHNWKVLDDDSHSDHAYISCDLRSDAIEPAYTRIKKKNDWIKYKRKVIGAIRGKNWNCLSISTLETNASDLNRIIIEAYSYSCSEKTIKSNFFMDWFLNNLKKERTDLRKLYKKLINARSSGISTALETSYKNKRNVYYKNIKSAKTAAW